MSKKRRPITINNKYFPVFDSDSKPIKKQNDNGLSVKGNAYQLLYYATGWTNKLSFYWILTFIFSILNYFNIIDLDLFWLLFPILWGSFMITSGFYMSLLLYEIEGKIKVRTN